MKYLFGAILYLICSAAIAEPFEEHIAYRCDTNNKQFYVYYETIWGDLAGVTDYKRRIATCNIDGTIIKLDYKIILSQAGGGACSYVPGGVINTLKIGALEVLKDIGLNHCQSMRLEGVLVTLRSDEIEITFCGDHDLSDDGTQTIPKNCFVEYFKKSKLPHRFYGTGNFPYSKFKSNNSLQWTPYDRAAQRP